MTKLKPVTETSWLVIGDTDDTRIGLLTEIRNNYILMVKGEKKQFVDRTEVNKYFNENVFENLVEIEQKVETKLGNLIKGYPTNFPNPVEVFLKGNTLPLYSKKATSDVIYSAGYFCIRYQKSWMPAFCPKLKTLQEYENFVGPLHTELERNLKLRALRKELEK